MIKPLIFQWFHKPIPKFKMFFKYNIVFLKGQHALICPRPDHGLNRLLFQAGLSMETGQSHQFNLLNRLTRILLDFFLTRLNGIK